MMIGENYLFKKMNVIKVEGSVFLKLTGGLIWCNNYY